MASCPHFPVKMATTWIDFRTRDHKFFLQEHPRAYSTLRGLTDPTLKRPQMITLFGGTRKSQLTRGLFLRSIGTGHNQIHLHLAPGSEEFHHPLLLADCELHNAQSFRATLAPPSQSNVEEHPVRWHRNMLRDCDPPTLASLVYTHVVFPFSNLLCFFADDYGGTRKVAEVLSSWMVSLSSRSSEVPPSALPRVLVLQDCGMEAAFDEKLATIDFMQALRQETDSRDKSFTQVKAGRLGSRDFEDLLRQQFSSIRVLPLPCAMLANIHLHRLRSRILQESQEVQDLRLSAKIAFSVHHIQNLMHLACAHFAADIVNPFNFVRATRISNPVPLGFAKHINRFFRLVPSKFRLSFGIQVVASALVMDSHPIDMHIFDPARVFSELYSDIIAKILVPRHTRDQSFIRQKVKTNFCSQLSAARGVRVAQSHMGVLQHYSQIWKGIYFMSTCLSCLARQPSYTLPCRHTLCESCVVVHGRASPDAPWTFAFKICPLCQNSAVRSISLKPPTAGVRGLTLDGGSIQDLLILRDIERHIQLPLAMREHFDIALGSGLGALVLLEVFCKEWSIDYCVRHSQALNSAVLGEDSEFDDAASQSKTRWARRVLRPLQDHRRNASRTAAIISSLKATFGQEPPLFQCAITTRVAVAALEAESHLNCTFANYNLPELARSEKPDEELALWELARIVTSQTSVHGYKARLRSGSNDLINTAFWDQDSFWLRSQRPLDRLLCLGSPVDAPAGAGHQWVSDCRVQKHRRDVIQTTADSLLASLFYVELAELPEIRAQGISCKVLILCRLAPAQSAYKAWVHKLRNIKARFDCHGRSMPCVDRHIYNEASQGIPYSRYIDLVAPSLHSVIDIKIRGLGREDHSISNCPYTIKVLIEDQGLHCVFGHHDHRDRFKYTLREAAEKGLD